MTSSPDMPPFHPVQPDETPEHHWSWREWTLWSLFVAVVIGTGLLYFGVGGPHPPPTEEPPAPVAPPAPPPPSLEDIRRLMAETPPGSFDPAWFPAAPDARWKRVLVHHSATRGGSPAAFDRYHREKQRMPNGLAYHFVIGNGTSGFGDGAVFVGDRWKKQLDGGHAHSPETNRVSIGVCLVGNFEEQAPTPAQIASLKALLVALGERCRIAPADVFGHGATPGEKSVCPGRYFPVDALRANLPPLPPAPAPKKTNR